MNRELHQRADVIRTQIERDRSGMVFVECSDPKLLLSLKAGETLQSDIERGIKGVFKISHDRAVEVYFAGKDGEINLWAVVSSEERVAPRAAQRVSFCQDARRTRCSA